MANTSHKTDSKRLGPGATSSSTFMLLTVLTGVVLVAAAAALWLGRTDEGRDPPVELALLSQAVTRHAVAGVAGDEEAFERLRTALARIAELKGAAPAAALPGGPAAWSRIEQHAGALLAHREAGATLNDAAAWMEQHVPATLAATDAWLEVSGATGPIQAFRERGRALVDGVAALAAGDAAPDLAGRLRDDLAWMQDLANGLKGGETTLDVAALPPESAVLLDPVIAELGEIGTRLEGALEAAGDLRDPQAELAGLAAGADAVLRAARAGGDAPARALPGILGEPRLPLVLVGLAVLLLAVLAWMHSRTAVYERASKRHAEQNDRNQQAILRLLDELGSLADGDLTVEATVTEDITGAIADSINYAIEKLRELVATINETAIMVDSAAKQTESTASHMARAADNQAREIRAVTESIESMAASIEEVSGNAERSSDVARHSVEVAHKGGEAVRRTIDGMNTIRETIQETSKRIKRLGESSQEIGNIIELINDIAEQTNILALNASIQASMAGEAGRGFAVVADEVQRLAERSTNATKQIEVLVRTIQADTNEAVVSMERSTTDVVGGALLAENAGAALDEIEQVSNQIASLVQNISRSARQQASAAGDVTRRTARLKEISEQAGKATSATAAAVAKLSVLASQLRQTVAGFTLPSSALNTSTLATRAAPRKAAAPAAEDRAAG
ncbi:MAG TPA: methyl-accepting chemotaxis protein [Woeseiaceae bacterium]|nr:methyl-accepting chemotaxis protein [Woeseiaceae bacterium]